MGKSKEKELKYKVLKYLEAYISTLPHKEDREHHFKWSGVLYNFIVTESPNADEIYYFSLMLFNTNENYYKLKERLES